MLPPLAPAAPPPLDAQRSPGATGLRRGSEVAILVAVSAAVGAIVFSRQLLLGRTFALRDFILYTWPARQALAEALAAGRLPEWNDFVAFGTPFAAMSTNGVAYPPLWSLAALPLAAGIHLVMALHLVAAGLGTALLARRLGASLLGASLAGAAFMTSGYVTSMLPVGTFLSLAWIPWVAWAADRVATLDGGGTAPRRATVRAVMMLALILAGQLLSGDPASAVTAGFVAAVLTLARSRSRVRSVALLATSAGAAVLMAAAVVLPGAAVVGWSNRAVRVDAFQWSLHPARLLELVWPDALGNPTDAYADLARALANTGRGHVEARWAFSIYLGGPLLALAVLSARARRDLLLVLGGSAFLVALALGSYSPLYLAYRAVFPPERLLQFPEKHVVGAVLIWCALAGVGLTRLRDALATHRTWFVLASCLPVGLAVATAMALKPAYAARLAAAAAAVHLPTPDPARALSHIFASGAAAFVVAAVAAVLLAQRRTWLAVAGASLLVTHAAELGRRLTPLVDVASVQAVPELLAGIHGVAGIRPRVLRWDAIEDSFWMARPTPQQFAIYGHETLLANDAGRYGLDAFPGYEGFRSQAFSEFLGGVLGTSGISALDFASKHGIDYLAGPAGWAAQLQLPVVGRWTPPGSPGQAGGGWSLVAAPRDRTRAFVAPRWEWVLPRQALARSLVSGRPYDPGFVVLTGRTTSDPSTAQASEPARPCAVSASRPEDVRLVCASASGGYAVLADENVPGWRATVDGVPAPIVTAEVLFRAVRIGPGVHEIRFSYRAPLLREGIAVSLVSLLAAAIVLAATFRGRRESAGGTDAARSPCAAPRA